MKKEQMTTKCLYDTTKSAAGRYLDGYTYPWEALSHIREIILALGEELSPDEYLCRDESVWIHKSVLVYPTATIIGPVIVGEGAQIRPGAFIRGNVLVGAGAVVGNSTEIKNSVLFDGVQVPHYNYIGDSILGYKAHMGASSLTSNVRSDKKPVVVHADDEEIETGLKKFGAMVGDMVEVGCGAVLNPGSIIGPNSSIYPLSSVRGGVEANSIYKRQGEIVEKR